MAITDGVLNVAHLFHALLDRCTSHSAADKGWTTNGESAAVRGNRAVSQHVALSCNHFDRTGGGGVGRPVAGIHAATVKRNQTILPDHAPAFRVGAGRHTDAERC